MKSFVNLLRKLNTPAKIQDFLDKKISINFEEQKDTCRSPLMVWKNKKAQCIEGAIFAAAALSVHGHKPLLVHMRASKKDVDHVIAVFKQNSLWGAISKSNHAVLRYRDPIYKNLRELVISYFHEYFDNHGQKNLREYSEPLDLTQFNYKNWITDNRDVWYIDRALNKKQRHVLVPKGTFLKPADPIEIRAGKLTIYKNRVGSPKKGS